MQLTSTIFVSVDGVYQGPGGPQEDTSGGFDRGGWIVPFFDEQAGAFLNEVFERSDAFLLGRRTYEIFAAYWPDHDDPNDPIPSKLNSLPKYVPSTTLKDAGWKNTTILGGTVAEAIRELKARPGSELQVHGSGTLVNFLLENDLLDRLNLLVFPIILGKGKRLFPESGLDTRLALEESRTTPSGVTISVFRPGGRPEYGDASA